MSIDTDRSGDRATRPIVTVLISRSSAQLAELMRVARDRKVRIIPFPLHTIEPTIDRIDPEEISRDLSECSWLLFTSANAVKIYCDFMVKHNIAIPETVAIGAIGRKTAQVVEECGHQAAICPADEVAEGLLEEVLRSEPERERTIIIPSAEDVRPVLLEGLTAAGYHARKLDIYRSVAIPRKLLPPITDEHIDYFCFLSSSAVERYHELFGIPQGIAVSIGKITTATMRGLGWTNLIEFPQPDLNRLWEVIDA